jgi:lactoylglutathione lyase
MSTTPDGPPRARKLFPMLSAADLERSVEFYAGLLGGRETYRTPPAGRPEFVVLTFADGEIGVGRMSGGPALHGRTQRPASGHRVELCVYVEDVDASVERMRTAGVPVVLEPCDQPWGERVAYVEDPDGNLVMLTR